MRSLPIIASVVLLAADPLPQEKPLERRFRTDDVRAYRVTLTVRSNVQGTQAEKIGARAYAKQSDMSADVVVSWRARRHVLSIAADGTAEVEESTDEFGLIFDEAPSPDPEEGKVREAVKRALVEWASVPRRFRYRESRYGQLSGLTVAVAPVLDDGPAVLSLWLRRALRPAAALPDRPHLLESRWTEPRAVTLAPWVEATGSESGAWLTGPLPQLSIVRFDNLHTVQQIKARAPATAGIPEGEARFYAESLSTLVGAGSADMYGGLGALVQATRSATREVTRTLDAVPGLPERPRFRATISVQVQITAEDCPPQ